jgi:hypothetical protein
MVKKVFYILLLTNIFASLSVSAQNEFSYNGKLRFSSSFSTGYMLKPKSSPIYLQGLLEYYFDNRISVRSDGYFFINETSNETFITNHQLFSGFSYHFLPGKTIDLFSSFQIGAAFSKAINLNYEFQVLIPPQFRQEYTLTTNPVYAVGVGATFFAQKWFNAFTELKYIRGNYISEVPSIRLDEIRFSFGLGFHLGLKKQS